MGCSPQYNYKIKYNSMKAFRVIYTHGHFVDIETNERLVPVQGEEYVISAKDNAFKTEDLKLDFN